MKKKRKLKELAIIFAILLVLAIATISIFSLKSVGKVVSGDCQREDFFPSPGENITISGNCLVDSEFLNFSQNVKIIVQSGASLTLSNSTLIFNVTDVENAGIIVEPGGELNITYTTLNRTNDSYDGYVIISHPNTNFSLTHSNVSGTGGEMMDENETGVVIYSNNAVIEHNNFLTNIYSLFLIYSDGSSIKHNYFNTGFVGLLITNSTNTDITNNTLGENFFVAAAIGYSDNITFNSNSLLSNMSWIGLEIFESINTYTRDNYFENYPMGILTLYTNLSLIENNIFFNVSNSISIQESHKNNITNNNFTKISNLSLLGVIGLQDSHNNLISNNFVNEGFNGIYLENSLNTTIYNNNLTDQSDYSFYLLDSPFYNFSQNNYSTLYYGFTIRAYVLNSAGSDVLFAEVYAYDKNEELQDGDSVALRYPEDENFARLLIPVITENNSNITYYNNYTFNASYLARQNSTILNITNIRDVTIYLMDATVCGNGVKEGLEACDGDDWGEISDCNDYHVSYESGNLSCNSDCTFNHSACIDEDEDDEDDEDDDNYTPPRCGDGICHSNENCTTCIADCGSCSRCGDLVCNGSETCSSCSVDCGNCFVCNDGVCNGSETCSSCAADCGACTLCGDNVCNGSETYATCSADCEQDDNEDNGDVPSTIFWIVLGVVFLFGGIGVAYLIYIILKGKGSGAGSTSTPPPLATKPPPRSPPGQAPAIRPTNPLNARIPISRSQPQRRVPQNYRGRPPQQGQRRRINTHRFDARFRR